MRILGTGLGYFTRGDSFLLLCGRIVSVRSLSALLIGIFAFGTIATSAAFGDECSSLARQIRSSGGGGVSPQQAQLRRQLVAIQALERRRQCSGKSSGGFFDPCGDLERMRADVMRQMAASSGGRDTSVLRARYVALGCAPERRERQAARASSSGSTSSASTWVGSTSMLYCVRPSDGYFFPAPKSQFARDGDLKETTDQCRFICDDPAMEVFALTDPSLETEEMISVAERRPYKELPTAFRYRDDSAFKSCDLRRYYSRVNEMRARTVTPGNMKNAVIPLPTDKPEQDLVGSTTADPTNVDAPAPMALMEEPASDRAVRIVGPAFLPDP
ncbi:DUF2865 domain-containing protein [Mesorhizobium sp. NPDC059054]|uniref:DUF2865 domain-containing protein n=1 Tax=Mesorhizobium sp. NPDC059054 TaxID=3346711 RepID=UPI00369A046A